MDKVGWDIRFPETAAKMENVLKQDVGNAWRCCVTGITGDHIFSLLARARMISSRVGFTGSCWFIVLCCVVLVLPLG